jgi:O-succinylbenzoic acid--CoA ligase
MSAMQTLVPTRHGSGWWLPGAGAAAAWLRRETTPGARVVVRGAPSPQLAALIQGAWAAGVCLIPINRRLTESEAAPLLTRAAADLVLDSALPDFSCDGDPGSDDHDPAAPAVVLFTSGTTGAPKAVRLSRRALRASAAAACLRLGLHADDRWSACLPLDHIGGIGTVLRSHLAGFRLHLHPRFDAAAVGADLDSGATGASLVPTMLHRLAQRDQPWAAAVRVLLIGGGPLDRRLAERVRDLGCAPCQTYGLTECASQVCTLAPDEAADGLGTAGTPLAGMEVSLTREGAIRVRGSALMDGYEGLPDPCDADGWFTTGDLGSFDAAGRLTVLGRHDEVIVSGGENIAPHEIEAVLERHPGIREAAVYGEPDPEWGMRVCAVLVAEAAPLPDAEMRQVLSELSDFKRPKTWRWTSSLPRTALGKLQRARLRS